MAFMPLEILPFEWNFDNKAKNYPSPIPTMLEESKEKPSGPGALSGAIENTVSLISSKENGPSNQDTFYGDKGFSVQSMNQPPGY